MNNKLYEYWETKSALYDGKVKGGVVSDDFSLIAKIPIKNKRILLTGKTAFNQKDTGLELGKEFSINQKFPIGFYTLSQKNDNTTLSVDATLYNKKNKLVTLNSKVNSDLTEISTDQKSIILNSLLRFHISNHTLIQVGVENLELAKTENQHKYIFNLMNGRALSNGMKAYGGFHSTFFENKMSKLGLAFSLKGFSFNSLLTLTGTKPDPSSSWEFVPNLQCDNKITQNVTIGGDVEIGKKKILSKIFTLYTPSPDTTIKAKWQDSDSLAFTVIHNIRKLFKVSATATVKPTSSDDSVTGFKTKFGVSLELNDTLL